MEVVDIYYIALTKWVHAMPIVVSSVILCSKLAKLFSILNLVLFFVRPYPAFSFETSFPWLNLFIPFRNKWNSLQQELTLGHFLLQFWLLHLQTDSGDQVFPRFIPLSTHDRRNTSILLYEKRRALHCSKTSIRFCSKVFFISSHQKHYSQVLEKIPGLQSSQCRRK